MLLKLCGSLASLARNLVLVGLAKCIQCLAQGVGPLLVGVCVSAISYCAWVFFKVLLHQVFVMRGSAVAVAVALVGVYLLTMLAFHYFSVMYLGPGFVADGGKEIGFAQRKLLANDPERPPGQPFR